MEKHEKMQNRQGELRAISILMLRHMEINLLPIDRIIFLRLLISFGDQKISTDNLKTLAEKIKVHWLTLKKTLGVLIENGLCEEVQKKVMRINKAVLPRQASYHYQWKDEPIDCKSDTEKRVELKDRYSQELKEDKSVKKTASKLVSCYPRHDFLEILFGLMFDVKISHKQKNADELLVLNYKQWLVLVNMVLSSDSNGIVFDVGTYELSKWTGMSRNALQRAITDLFDMRILRSKLDGSLNSNLLQSVASVYCINLSASIWEDKRIFGNYYFLKFPKEFKPMAYQAFNLIKDLRVLEQVNKKCISEKVVLNEHSHSSSKDIGSILSDNIREEFNFASKFDKDFGQYMQLTTSNFRLGKSLMNTETANLSRIVFLLTYFIKSRIFNMDSFEFWLNITMPIASIEWFKNYLTKITLSDNHPCKLLPDEKNVQEANQVVQIVEEARAKILFSICQAILRSEVMPIIKDVMNLVNSKDYFDLALLPSQNSVLCDRVYFCRYGADGGAQKTGRDIFYTLELKKISDYPEEFKLESKKFEDELTFDEQKQFGLFNLKKEQ